MCSVCAFGAAFLSPTWFYIRNISRLLEKELQNWNSGGMASPNPVTSLPAPHGPRVSSSRGLTTTLPAALPSGEPRAHKQKATSKNVLGNQGTNEHELPHDCRKPPTGSRGAFESQSPPAALGCLTVCPFSPPRTFLPTKNKTLAATSPKPHLKSNTSLFPHQPRPGEEGPCPPRVSGRESRQLHPITSVGKSVNQQVGDARQTCLV